MVYYGKIRNGRIELEPPTRLPEGTTVRVEPVDAAAAPAPASPGADDPIFHLAENTADFGPSDLAAQHDHYIYGTPKRE